jgi:hypothetical protein
MAMAYYIPTSKEVVPVGHFQFLGWVGFRTRLNKSIQFTTSVVFKVQIIGLVPLKFPHYIQRLNNLELCRHACLYLKKACYIG